MHVVTIKRGFIVQLTTEKLSLAKPAGTTRQAVSLAAANLFVFPSHFPDLPNLKKKKEEQKNLTG